MPRYEEPGDDRIRNPSLPTQPAPPAGQQPVSQRNPWETGWGQASGGAYGKDGSGSQHVEDRWTSAMPVGSQENAGYFAGQASKTYDNPQVAFHRNNNMTQPGFGEEWWAQNQGRFDGPTASQGYYDQNKDWYGGNTASGDYWSSVQGQYGAGGPGYAKSGYDAAMGVSQNLDPYYDRAFSRGADQVNRQMAARGMFGSSAATRDITDLSSNLGAEQANREADFGLQRARDIGNLGAQASQDELSWMEGMGNLAGQADDASLGRREAGANAAVSADTADLSQALGGANSAFKAQDAREGRIDTLYDNMFGQDAAYAGIASGANDQALDDFLGTYGDEIAMQLGIPREELNQLMLDRENRKILDGNAADVLKTYISRKTGGKYKGSGDEP